MKKIWKLGYEISVENLPDFLDEKCMEFVYSV